MYQTWDKLLFLHWPVAAERLRPLIAPRLSLDTFEGQAWVSVTPFTMWGGFAQIFKIEYKIDGFIP
jgi:uncharacterized protein